jgi:hypothetical protein
VLPGPFEEEAEALGDEKHRHLGLQARDVFENDQQLAAEVQEAIIELPGGLSKSTLQSSKTKQRPNYCCRSCRLVHHSGALVALFSMIASVDFDNIAGVASF